ncbi:MAG: hypothetical protein HY290_21555 [Planctomycetia bacterium]|nr:hypothetical protein [Planctomycetia bacterium]
MSFTPHRERPSLVPGGFGLRLLAMLGALALIGATIYSLRNQFLAARAAERAAGQQAPVAVDPKTPWKETIIPGPSDEDPAEREDMKRLLEVVSDQRAIEAVDSPAYFRMLKWAMSRPISELEERARRDILFTDLWQQPQKHRAELIRLRMHVVRVIRNDKTKVVENSLGLENLYEICAWTDDSADNPYVVVVPELPPGIRIGVESSGEIVFVGYFLKVFAYDAFQDKHRGAPMLVGRIRTVAGANPHLGASRASGLTAMLVGGGVLICVIVLLVALFRMTRGTRRRPVSLSSSSTLSTEEVENWLEHGRTGDPDAAPSADRLSPAVTTNGQSHHHENGSTRVTGEGETEEST